MNRAFQTGQRQAASIEDRFYGLYGKCIVGQQDAPIASLIALVEGLLNHAGGDFDLGMDDSFDPTVESPTVEASGPEIDDDSPTVETASADEDEEAATTPVAPPGAAPAAASAAGRARAVASGSTMTTTPRSSRREGWPRPTRASPGRRGARAKKGR